MLAQRKMLGRDTREITKLDVSNLKDGDKNGCTTLTDHLF